MACHHEHLTENYVLVVGAVFAHYVPTKNGVSPFSRCLSQEALHNEPEGAIGRASDAKGLAIGAIVFEEVIP